MKKLLLSVILSIVPFLNSIAQGDGVNNSIIAWDSDNKLEWSDFQGEIDPDKFGSAMTSHKIEILPMNVMVDEEDNIQGYENMTVQAQFFKEKSWTATTSNYMLSHEQLHFDIAELFARKIRKRFEELKSNEIATFSKYQKAYSLLWKECRRMQIRYDKETKHGQLQDINSMWEKDIAEQLNDLKEFK
ncbi:DUF922 domain-containing Zn-dependent protease [Flavobacteriaceae bacterium TK19130]|nr:DUF922 domain-containing Zn-dependent protease [Thermobacterium salinum]